MPMPTSLRDRRAGLGPARRLRSLVHSARTPQERVLALQRTIGNRATRRLLGRTPVNPTREELPLGEYDDAGKQQWPLLYRDYYGSTEDEDGYVNWRQIAENDPEFEADYIDYNIVNATVLVTLDTGEYDAIKVHYKDGRTRTFAKGDIPNPKFTRKYKQRGQARTPLLDAFEKREEESTQDAFIYPTYKEQIVLSPYLAPNLGSIREQADELAAELAKLRQLAYVAGQFASILAMYGAVAGRPHTSRSRFVGFPGLRNRRAVTTGAMPRARPNAPQAPQGGKKNARTKPATMTLGNKKPPSRTPVKAKPTTPKSGNKKQGKVDVESGKDVGKQRETAREGGEGGKGKKNPRQTASEAEARTRTTQAPATDKRSLLQRARDAGVSDEIDGAVEVFAYGTTESSANSTVSNSGFSTGGGNFGGRRYAATNVDTARVFAARRVTNATKPNMKPADRPRRGIVGIALPKATADRLQATAPAPRRADDRSAPRAQGQADPVDHRAGRDRDDQHGRILLPDRVSERSAWRCPLRRRIIVRVWDTSARRRTR